MPKCRKEYNRQWYLKNKEKYQQRWKDRLEKEAKDPSLREKRLARDSERYRKHKENKKRQLNFRSISDKELARVKYRDIYARRKNNNGRVSVKYPPNLSDKQIQEMILRDEARRVKKIQDSTWLTEEEKVKRIRKIYFPNSRNTL